MKCLFLLLILVKLCKAGSISECPQNKVSCLRKHLTTDPSECESDSNIQLDFIKALGEQYDASGLIPIDSYFLWAKIREESSKDPNLEIIPEETKDLGPYALNNLQYTQLLEEIKDLKVWKASDDCTIWSTTVGKKQRLTKSSEVWLSLAKLLRSKEWEEKLVIFGKQRPSPIADAYSDDATPARFVLQNLINEHNHLVSVNWIKELSKSLNKTEVQVERQKNKCSELEVVITQQENKLGEALESTSQLNRTSEQSKSDLIQAQQLFNKTFEDLNVQVEELRQSLNKEADEVLTIKQKLETITSEQIQLNQKVSYIESNVPDQESSGHSSDELVGNNHSIETETQENKTLIKRNASRGSGSSKLNENVKEVLQIVRNVNRLWDQISQLQQSVSSNLGKIQGNKNKIQKEHDWGGKAIAKDWRDSNSTILRALSKLIPETDENLCKLCISISLIALIISLIVGISLIVVIYKLYKSRKFKVRSTVQLLPERTLQRSRSHQRRVVANRHIIRTPRGRERNIIELRPSAKSVKWCRVRQSSV